MAVDAGTYTRERKRSCKDELIVVGLGQFYIQLENNDSENRCHAVLSSVP